MHSNNTQVQVQIPAAYYSLGSVAMNGSLGFSGHEQSTHSSNSNSNSGPTTPLHPYHPANNAISSQFHHHHSQNHHHSHSPTQGSAYHGQQQQQQPYTSSPHSNSNGNSNTNSNNSGYHTDLQKTIPIQHQVDIYQPPHQPLDQELMNPLTNRQLNNQHASQYHAPYNYHQHYSSQHGSYHYSNASKQQSQPPQQAESDQQQQRSNASTPTPTVASTLSTVSSASTPSLSSSTSTLQSSQDFAYSTNGNNNHSNNSGDASTGNRPSSPASANTPSSSFHIPASPDQLNVGSHLPSPLASHAVGMTQAMPTWTPSNGSSMEQELRGNSSPKNDRPYYPQAQTSSHLYSPQDQPQQAQQAWVASMAADEFLEQDRQQHQHQRTYSQSARSSYGHSQTTVVSQPNLPAMGGLPLLSPSNMLQSDYQSTSYPMSMHETPTVMSHPSMAPPTNGNTSSRYGGPIRNSHKKTRTTSMGSQREFGNRTRANSVNSTGSSVASNGVLSTLATTLGSTSLSAAEMAAKDDDEDSDSPTTIQMRPRANTAPRKAVAARVFECSVPGCTKAYTQLHNLKSHERTGHTPVIKLKPFHCIIEGCAKAFSQRKSLATHIKTAHAEFKFKPFKCTQNGCTKSYTQLHNLRTHEKTVHLVDLSRKRIKNPNNGNSSSMGNGFDNKGQGQSYYQPHPSQGPHGPGSHHSALNLGYGGLDDLSDLGLSSTGMPVGEDSHHYSRHHQHAQPQYHHQQPSYARLPHLNPISGMHDRP
ncbi:hypothetical protein BGZ70_005779 [Mortierella alpina]|uniref:C2H2-type domain-containing protein n=1 Tax=Mortierella alpina TaxID=64518 RepID=A0A9P6M4C0_MORAP|nr:hypothetical protein BGZ70_005779 [Mortierella alpina]